VVKVHCGGTHHPTTREAQGACREARARGSVYQNLGSTNRNLIPRLYRRTRLHNKLKSKRCAKLCKVNQTSKRGKINVLPRSEEHTSELQSRFDLVCRLLLEKKKTQKNNNSMKMNK